MTQITYVTYYNSTAKGKFVRGWYCFATELVDRGTGEKLVVHKNQHTYSKKSRGEAIEKFAKLKLNITSNTFHHVGVVCLDYRFDPKDIAAA